jgi:hypothetical protein
MYQVERCTPGGPSLARAHRGVTQNRFSLWRFPCEPLCTLWLFAGHTGWPIPCAFFAQGVGFHGRRPLGILILAL